MKRILLASALVVFGAQVAYGQTAKAYINGAKARMSKNKWDDARQVLADHIDEYPESAEMHYLYAVTLSRVSADSSAKAVEHLRVADSLVGNVGDEDLREKIDGALEALWAPMVNEGARLLSAGDLDAAEAKLRMAVAVNPEGKEGFLALGAVLHARQDWDSAIDSYNRAIELDPVYKAALIRLGQAYQEKAQSMLASADPAEVEQAMEVAGMAAEVYEGYLEQDPGDIEVQIQLAGLYASLGEMEKAEPVIRDMMQSEDIDPEVYTDFGFRLANAGQNELAEELLVKAVLASDSLFSEPLSYLAFVRIRLANLEGARVILDKQLELDPSNPEAWEYKGYVLRDLGDTDAAVEAFEKAESIPLSLENLTLGQNADATWNVDATFSNRLEVDVSDVSVRFTLVSHDGRVVETQETSLGQEQLGPGEAESVRIQFSAPAENPRIRYEIL